MTSFVPTDTIARVIFLLGWSIVACVKNSQTESTIRSIEGEHIWQGHLVGSSDQGLQSPPTPPRSPLPPCSTHTTALTRLPTPFLPPPPHTHPHHTTHHTPHHHHPSSVSPSILAPSVRTAHCFSADEVCRALSLASDFFSLTLFCEYATQKPLCARGEGPESETTILCQRWTHPKNRTWNPCGGMIVTRNSTESVHLLHNETMWIGTATRGSQTGRLLHRRNANHRGGSQITLVRTGKKIF